MLGGFCRMDWLRGWRVAVQQTAPDSGSGANFGAFKGRVIGLGPLVGATAPIFKLPISFSFKYELRFAGRSINWK